MVVDSPVGPDKEVDCPDGGPLVDHADEARLPIPFSCRSASCATCHVEVIEGAEYLEPAEEDERDLLDVIDAGENARLACQMCLKAGAGLVKVRPV